MSYPKAFGYYLSKVNNFSRQQLELQTFANTQFTPNQQMVIELPQGLIDLSTFTLKGLVASSGAGVYLPPIELLFDSYAVECGGVSVQNGFTNYGDLFNIFRQYQMEDKKNFRKILQLEGRQETLAATGENAVTDATAIPFAMYNFLGFLGSVKVLDTTLLPPVKIYFRLAPSTVMTKHADSSTTPSFTLSDVKATVDILDIADGVYYNMISQRLAQAPLEIPFENYQTVVGGAGTTNQNTRWSTSADCLEAVIATFKVKAAASFTPDTTTKLSSYFTRGTNGVEGTKINTSQFKVNSIPYPARPCQTKYEDVFVDTAHTLGASQDVLGATDAGMTNTKVWNEKYWVHAHSFTYTDADDGHKLVGVSGRGNQLLGDWETTGTTGTTGTPAVSDSLQPLLWLKCKSILRIGAGRMVELVL